MISPCKEEFAIGDIIRCVADSDRFKQFFGEMIGELFLVKDILGPWQNHWTIVIEPLNKNIKLKSYSWWAGNFEFIA